MGKGSKQRPTDQIKYSDNWDRIFNKDKKDLKYESDNPLERPFEPRDMWDHLCGDGLISVAVGQSCNWCGIMEDGTYD